MKTRFYEESVFSILSFQTTLYILIMKKLLRKNLILSLLILYTLASCNLEDQGGEIKQLENAIKKYQAEVERLNQEIANKDKVDEKYIQSFTIDRETALSYQNEYIETRYNLINENLGITDSREVWFPLEQLETYLKYTRNLARENNYENLGIRFYLGVYDEDYRIEEYRGFTTLFYVPTFQNRKANKVKSANFFAFAAENENMSEARAGNMGSLGQPPKSFE